MSDKKHRNGYNLEPLRIRAYLRSGVVADRYLPLDGILLYQAHRMQDGPQTVTISGGDKEEDRISGPPVLPLEIRHQGSKNWYYRCSWAQWSHDIEGRDYWNKRFDSGFVDLINFDGKRGRVVIEQGRYKAYHMPVFYRAALWVEWFCLGDKKEIEEMLCTVTHVGKKSSQGWGRISRWEIETCKNDYSVWKDGALMRGVPGSDIKGAGMFNFQYYGIRPSYWKSSNQMMLAVPF